MQTIIKGRNSYQHLYKLIKEHNIKRFMLVCDNAYPLLPVKDYIDKLNVPYIIFNQFKSNPLYEDVCKGIELFEDNKCDSIIAIGGGSAIDVAKSIKLFFGMDKSKNYLNQNLFNNNVLLIAIPTTAGTGSESTKYAVIYYQGEKKSITHDSLIPRYTLLDYRLLTTLPAYQKKCTMLDAFCQGIESYWSINANHQSKRYSAKAIKLIVKYSNSYMNNLGIGQKKIMLAANYSGRAINITQTTAPHAMSYKLTSIYKLPHGHAVAICLPKVWKFMDDNINHCIHPKGPIFLSKLFKRLSKLFKCKTIAQAMTYFEDLLMQLDIKAPIEDDENTLNLLANSVNIVRLKNNPINLTYIDLKKLYKMILS